MHRKGHKKGDIKRTVRCNFCGGEHRRRSKEARECRARAKRGQEPLAPKLSHERAVERRAGGPTTRYENDPLRGNARAHSIAKKVRKGWPRRKIAQTMNVSMGEVKDVAEKIGR